MKSRSPAYLDVAALGLLAGMRSMAAPALVSRSSAASTLFGLLATGEMAADKLPGIPARIAAGPLVGRVLSGAASGAILGRRRGRSWLGSALVGGVAAAAGAYGAYYLRRELGRLLPDPLLGALEDGLVLALGQRLRL